MSSTRSKCTTSGVGDNNKGNTTENVEKVKADLYNRLMYAHGADTQQRIGQASVLLIGLSGGPGCEIAKNLVLSGVKEITLFDPREVRWVDLCTVFFASPEDVVAAAETEKEEGNNKSIHSGSNSHGKGRKRSVAEVIAPKLAELNRFVTVNVFDEGRCVEEEEEEEEEEAGEGGKEKAASRYKRCCQTLFDFGNLDFEGGDQEGRDVLPSSLVKSHQVIVLCNIPMTSKVAISINEQARRSKVKFVAVETAGVAGAVFVDGGDNFTIYDSDGEPTRTCLILGMSDDGVINVNSDKRHDCDVGEYVYFQGITSPAELNSEVNPDRGESCGSPSEASNVKRGKRLFKVIKVMGPTMLQVELPKDLVSRRKGGEGKVFFNAQGAYLNTTKTVRSVSFRSLEQSLKEPEFQEIYEVSEKYGQEGAILNLFRTYHRYLIDNKDNKRDGVVPRSGLIEAASRVIPGYITEKENPTDGTGTGNEGGSDVIEVTKKLINTIGPVMNGNLTSISCFFGGFTAQEVLKLCSGKFSPTMQWFCQDFREMLASIPVHDNCAAGGSSSSDTTRGGTQRGTTGSGSAVVDRTVKGGRYDGQILVIGNEVHERLTRQRVFIVGAGALGCELIKNVALMGIGTYKGANEKEGGKVIITDMDNIEMSNLSRQFLFRVHHIGKPKSSVAAEAAKAINKDLAVVAMTDKVAIETEYKFNDAFWNSLDLVINALDNVQTRRYVDSQCLNYKKPLFESGTLGPKCSMQVIIPFLTTNYGSTNDPSDNRSAIPLCTLKNFPTAIEHTIQWARDAFHLHFVNVPSDVNCFLTGGAEKFEAMLEKEPGNKPIVQAAVSDAIRRHPRSVKEAVVLARELFDDLFDLSIRQLLYNIPLDKVDDKGVPFWSGNKKPPRPQPFVPSELVKGVKGVKESDLNPLHRDFLIATTALIARVHGIDKRRVEQELKELISSGEIWRVAASAPAKAFVPKVTQYAVTEENNAEDNNNNPLVNSGGGGVVMPSPEEIEKAFGPLLPLPPPPSPSSSSSSAATTSDPNRPTNCGAVNLMIPESFEKDDDGNHHIDFITAVSNMRATNYNIPTVDRAKTKQIAGAIMPAMVTTTAFITGAVCTEVIKYVAGERKLSNYRGLTTSLALPLLVWNIPEEPASVTYYEHDLTEEEEAAAAAEARSRSAESKATASSSPITDEQREELQRRKRERDIKLRGKSLTFGLWDTIIIDEKRDLTLQELVEYIEEKFNVEIFMISTTEGKTIYMSFSTKKDRLGKKVGQIIKEMAESAAATSSTSSTNTTKTTNTTNTGSGAGIINSNTLNGAVLDTSGSSPVTLNSSAEAVTREEAEWLNLVVTATFFEKDVDNFPIVRYRFRNFSQ